MSDATLANDVGRPDGHFETFRPCASEGRSAELLHPLSGEQRFWLAALERLLAPAGGRGGALSRALAWVTVVPLTNFTPFSLTYQAYLNLIFHRSAVARIGHSIFIPLTVFWLMVSACPIVGETPSSHTIGASTLLAWNGAAVVAIWYAAWAALERSLLWGITSVIATAVMWIGANAYWTALHLGGGAPWYAPTPAPATPLLWMAVSAVLQALSHSAEPAFPPRMNGTTHWIPIRGYMRGEPGFPSSHMSSVERLSGGWRDTSSAAPSMNGWRRRGSFRCTSLNCCSCSATSPRGAPSSAPWSPGAWPATIQRSITWAPAAGRSCSGFNPGAPVVGWPDDSRLRPLGRVPDRGVRHNRRRLPPGRPRALSGQRG